MALPNGVSLSRRQLADLDSQLRRFFKRRVTSDNGIVEELVQESLLRLLDDRRSCWNPERGALVTFAVRVVARGVLRDHKRIQRRRRRREVLRGDIDVVAEDLDLTRLPGDDAVTLARLRQLSAGDPDVGLFLEAMLGSREPWRALDRSGREVHNVKRRLSRLVRKLNREMKTE